MGSTSRLITPLTKQIWASLGVLINILGQGMIMGYPSCLLHALMASDSPIKTDLNTASWIASVAGLASVLGSSASSLLMDWCGRKKTFILSVLPSTLGWLFIYFAKDITSLMIGRFLCGMTGGATVGVGAIVIGEYTSPKIRGMLLNLKTTAICLGSLMVHLLGEYYDWRTVALIALVPQIVALIICWTWPESPAWLASVKQFKKSEKSYLWLRGNSAEAKKEFEDFIQAQKHNQSKATKDLGLCGNIGGFFKKFTRKDMLKPVIILCLGGCMVEACGRHIFPAYAKEIVESLTMNKTQAFYYTLFFDVIITISTTVGSMLIKVVNRRTMLFCTGIPALIVLFFVCLYLLLASKDIVSNTSLIPFIGFVTFFVLANLGCTLIPFVLFGEIFPLANRGAGLVVVGIIVSTCVMVGIKVTPYLLVTIKIYGTFAIFGVITGVVLLILYFIQPETKDKTLQEIEDYFNYGGFRDYAHKEEDDEEASVKPLVRVI